MRAKEKVNQLPEKSHALETPFIYNFFSQTLLSMRSSFQQLFHQLVRETSLRADIISNLKQFSIIFDRILAIFTDHLVAVTF